ncbi:hypothetical protein QZH56_22680 [Streptomyces olivoreticuli]|uniref:hypothetical protein n=1 Tax=Streptomyces olivoreticuli TaxID=68246 RepID=UPI00265A6538|nr:hypothetical protein [Streptomyces olivoreticuli]WKK21648.1 hypothetical protein QZH56_22680 [Streptomyces olivoreticuli]
MSEKKEPREVNASSEDVRTVHPKDAEALIGRLSSGVLDVTQLHGEMTPGGPAAVSYDQADGKYSMQHDWSVWKLSPDELTQGFQRLRDGLPGNGWRVTHYGPANSKAQQLEITAVHEKDGASLSAELLIRSTRQGNAAGASKTDLINFNVASPTYRAPQGVDPSKY